jgi:hypothetical protein
VTTAPAPLGSRTTRVVALTVPEVLALPALVPVWPDGAAAVGGISRTVAYDLARTRTFPVDIVEIHHKYYCRRSDLLRFLGLDGAGPTTPPI